MDPNDFAKIAEMQQRMENLAKNGLAQVDVLLQDYDPATKVLIGAGDYEEITERRVNDAQGIVTGIYKQAADLFKSNSNGVALHAVARPIHKALSVAFNLVDPEVLRAFREEFARNWKQAIFLEGKRVKEGKRKYPIAIFANERFKQMIKVNKDLRKAKLMYDLHRKDLMPMSVKSLAPYVSSKGFHKVLMGRVQKQKADKHKIVIAKEKPDVMMG